MSFPGGTITFAKAEVKISFRNLIIHDPLGEAYRYFPNYEEIHVFNLDESEVHYIELLDSMHWILNITQLMWAHLESQAAEQYAAEIFNDFD
ncbi:uncharacterized protein TRIVIDRAFT_220811 [Trichoderma virens Gv29-8]|uniref:Uncharacterized protein n=1 Tax=Hypocrea virens (strain Gv29-8 / FGSC 10586) TaxID=413071 RepID=G9MNU8_HYPVG|nr:uncharacterized protein TRIVIDRAFT_220811 [Trichoderma virens Gv29-8]EHK23551.1 hypothetical protein TRIVIDRAFT_220811 [Trichoderma virens Gv29-8]UKZ49847.1 hypothetical protein TrVGV298_004100 [Trichoderma virens]